MRFWGFTWMLSSHFHYWISIHCPGLFTFSSAQSRQKKKKEKKTSVKLGHFLRGWLLGHWLSHSPAICEIQIQYYLSQINKANGIKSITLCLTRAPTLLNSALTFRGWTCVYDGGGEPLTWTHAAPLTSRPMWHKKLNNYWFILLMNTSDSFLLKFNTNLHLWWIHSLPYPPSDLWAFGH